MNIIVFLLKKFIFIFNFTYNEKFLKIEESKRKKKVKSNRPKHIQAF